MNSVAQNKGFLPSILKNQINPKKKSPNKSEKNLQDFNSPPNYRKQLEKLYDMKINSDNNSAKLTTSILSNKGLQKSTLPSPKSSMQFVSGAFATTTTSKIKEFIMPVIQTTTVHTSRSSRAQLATLKLEKEDSREDLKFSLSPTPRMRIQSDVRMSKSLNPRKNRMDFLPSGGGLKNNSKLLSRINNSSVENLNDESGGSFEEERKSYDNGDMNTCEDEKEEVGYNGGRNSCTLSTIQSISGQLPPNANNNGKNCDNNKDAKKKKKGFAALSEMVPMNLEKEQQLFFQNAFKYNPNFEYISQNIKQQFSKPHAKYLKIAKLILSKCIDEYGTDDAYLERTGGRMLSKDETTQYFEHYIKELGFEECLSLVFSENTVAPTSVVHDPSGKSRVIISLPITYREHRIRGVLNHEIGTHFIRKYNDRLQPWFKNRKKFDLKPYIIIEEGLAALNQTLDAATDSKRKPYLFNAALHYYSAYIASLMSFEELFHDLEKYISDPMKRWKECVRVKRGCTDTAQTGGMYKDQVYLRGAIEILKNRKKIDFVLLHSGKINVKDLFKLQKLGIIKLDGLKMPTFMHDLNTYREALNRMAAYNFLDRLK
jgi:hypothetical protein